VSGLLERLRRDLGASDEDSDAELVGGAAAEAGTHGRLRLGVYTDSDEEGDAFWGQAPGGGGGGGAGAAQVAAPGPARGAAGGVPPPALGPRPRRQWAGAAPAPMAPAWGPAGPGVPLPPLRGPGVHSLGAGSAPGQPGAVAGLSCECSAADLRHVACGQHMLQSAHLTDHCPAGAQAIRDLGTALASAAAQQT
jgi:hypothetical protein